MKYNVYTDGGCRNNNNANNIGSFAYIILNDKNEELSKYYKCIKNTTNNKMELLAVINAIKKVIELDKNFSIDLYTDSQYVCNGANIWIHNWKKNNWKNSKKTSVLNIELWQELDKYLFKYKDRINIKWVKGHKGHPFNEEVDLLVNLAMDTLEPELYDIKPNIEKVKQIEINDVILKDLNLSIKGKNVKNLTNKELMIKIISCLNEFVEIEDINI